MENKPKRRVISLSLSQSRNDGRRTRHHRNQNPTKSFDSVDQEKSKCVEDEKRRLSSSKFIGAPGGESSKCVVSSEVTCASTDKDASGKIPNLLDRNNVACKTQGKKSAEQLAVVHPEHLSASCFNKDDNEQLKQQNISVTENKSNSGGDQRHKSLEHESSKKENTNKHSFDSLASSKDSVLKVAQEINSKAVESVVAECTKNLDFQGSSSKKTRAQSSVEVTDPLPHSEQTAVQSMQSFSEQFPVMQCPVCFKSFEKISNKSAHLKACALKHGMTTRQLVDALDLQKRQTAEREALGLPLSVGHTVSASAKSKNRKNTQANHMKNIDSGLQLALALSLSLHDHEKATLNRDAIPADVPCLENFGFVSKPVLESINSPQCTTLPKSKGKASSKPIPVLLTRTAEERQQILTEKVAMVLMEEIDLTAEEESPSVNLMSDLLQQYHNKDKSLWSKSNVSPSKADRASFYVQELQSFISPSKVETGSKVMHLSQVPCRVKTPEKERNTDYRDEVQSLPSVKLTDEDSPSDTDSSKSQSSECVLKLDQNVSKLEVELRAKLFNDWAGMVNNLTMSDVVIYPQEGRDIPAHKLLLLVRCPKMFQDISKQLSPITGNEVDVIVWSKVPHVAALAFLEYLYCGAVKSIPALSDDLSSIKWLATHYNVTDLLKYLKAVTHAKVPPSQAAIAAASDFEGQNTLTENSQVTSLRQEFVTPENDIGKVNQFSEVKGSHSSQLSHQCISLVRNEEPIRNEPTLDQQLNESSSNLVPLSVSQNIAQSSPQSEGESIYSQPTLSEPGSRRSLSPDMFQNETEEEDDNSLRENRKNIPSQNHLNSLLKSSSTSLETVMESQTGDLSPSSDSTVILRADESSENNLSPKGSRPDSGDFVENSFLTVDPKRKLSDHSNEDRPSTNKRLCSHNVDQKTKSCEDISDIEYVFDLTQDSNCESLPLNESPSPSIIITSGSENHNSDDEKENTRGRLLEEHHDGPVVSPLSLSAEIEKSSNSFSRKNEQKKSPTSGLSQPNTCSLQGAENGVEGSGAPYISPVWDGFEDLNYDEPCPSAFITGPEKCSVTVSDLGKSLVDHSPISERKCPIVDSKLEDSPIISKNVIEETSSSFEELLDDSFNHILAVGCSQISKRICPSTESEHVLKDSPAKNVQEKASSSFGKLLDDSFNHILTDSILGNAEKECGGVSNCTTPKTLPTPVSCSLSKEAVTPLADYSAMKTPQLKKEMKRFGLKPSLGKRKGKIMLRHIYNELHPWIPDSNKKIFNENVSEPGRNLQTVSLSQPSTSKRQICPSEEEPGPGTLTQTTSSDDDCDLNRSSSSSTSYHEGSFLEDFENDLESLSQAATQSVERNMWRDVKDFISSDPQLHQSVLEYEPIWVERLHTDLRIKGIKIKMADLMALLDEKCITFRTISSGPRVKKRRKTTKNVPKKSSTQSMDEAELSV